MKHDYEPDRERAPHPMSSEPPCRICGKTRRACEKAR